MAFKISIEGDESDAAEALRRLGVAGKDSAGDLEKTDAASKKLSDTLEKMEKDSERSADALEKLAVGEGAANQVTEAFGATSTTMQGFSDIMTVMGEQLGISLGPAQEWVQAGADLAGGLEGAIGGGKALADQFGPMAAKMGPVITGTWAHVTALYAQATAFIAANAPMIAIIATLALLAAGVVLVVKHWDEIVEKVPALGVVVEGVKTGLQGFADWITGTFIPAVASLYDPAIKVPLDLIVSYFTLQFNLVKTGVETVMGVIKGVIDVFMGLITGDWDRAWAGLKQIVDSLVGGVKESFNLVIGFFADDLGPRLLSAGKGLGSALKDGFISGIEGLVGLGASVGNAVIGLIESAINRMISVANDAIPDHIGVSVAGKEIGFNIPQIPGVEIPRLAKGGIVPATPGGRLIIAGEGGDDEAVIPMKELQALQGGASGGSGGVTPIGGAGYSVTVPGAGTALLSPEQAQENLNKLLMLVRLLDQASQDMWWADPKNQLEILNLERAIVGLEPLTTLPIKPANTPAPVGGTPGIEGGSSLPTPSRPSGGQSGAAAGGGAPAAGGGGKTDPLMEALVEQGVRQENRIGRLVVLVERLVATVEQMAREARDPQTIELVAKPGALQALAAALYDPLAQISRRQGAMGGA